MDRRQFLSRGGSAALAAGLVPGSALAQGLAAPGASARLAGLMDQIAAGDLRLSPESMTALGIDTGSASAARHRLDDYGRAGMVAEQAFARTMLDKARAIAVDALAEKEQVRHAVVVDMLERRLTGVEHGMGAVAFPYVISQMSGAYYAVPAFLASQHPVESADDAEAYLDRLSGYAIALDDQTELQREQAARGFLAPGWSLDMVAQQIAKQLAGDAGQSAIVQSLTQRAADKGIAGEWQTRAAGIVERTVRPALQRQLDAVKRWRGKAAAGDGIWRVPHGEDIYRRSLAYSTTTDLSPEEVHAIGLEQVAEISAQLDTVLAGAGLTTGTVGERLTALNERPDQIYPDSAAGRAELIASLNVDVQAMQAKLPQAFATVPTQPLEVRAVPEDIQDGAPLGYYYSPSLDGSRPGIYWINLKSMSDWPKYSLPALTYHEGVPGHHLQGSILQEEEDLPLLLKSYYLSAYGEGWALYAEQVAQELGGYEGISLAGALQSWLFRAARLVVDTGLHHKRWSVERGTQYFLDAVGYPPGQSLSEARRYCIWPGQACSYKIGQNKWRELRARAERKLGDRFDVRQFHEVLKEGVMPLSLLERRIDTWISEQAA